MWLWKRCVTSLKSLCHSFQHYNRESLNDQRKPCHWNHLPETCLIPRAHSVPSICAWREKGFCQRMAYWQNMQKLNLNPLIDFLEIIRLQMTLPHPTFCCLWSGTGLHCLFPVWALCVQCKHFMSCPAWSIRLSGRCPPTLKKAAIRMEMVNAACLMVGRHSEAHYGHTIHSLNSLYAPWVLLRRVH